MDFRLLSARRRSFSFPSTLATVYRSAFPREAYCSGFKKTTVLMIWSEAPPPTKPPAYSRNRRVSPDTCVGITVSNARNVWSGRHCTCLLYTSDAADDLLCVDLGGRRII